ncbi:alpha/beta fold hydrolase [Achromobacter xylosoxidans]|nr:hypothetical protein [Achromobacter xylosoxidans]WPQ36169.1 hypothetical protein SLH34_04755 [Achromobacter xylosoxidans]
MAARPICTRRWGRWRDLRGGVLADCGHYLPEEQPRELARRMLAFLA